MIAIVDYGAGNQTSVRRALDHLGIPCVITADPDTLLRAAGVIFPGVGAAGQAMSRLRAEGLDRALRDVVDRGIPLLGVCLGCQILTAHSEEDDGTVMLGLAPGDCRRFGREAREEDGVLIRVPHMGWNRLRDRRPTPLFAGIPEDAQFYFVHSYYVSTTADLTLASCRYGIDFCAAYGRDGLWAVQFHPEKSGPPGLRLLRNFVDCCGDRSC
ncbi:MAG: imidazole glycerol phosphate synthase subunit HisH [Deltaproteobacteria bacterium]|jgi:glutamine amidotransferase|nr:imidazole glycerol phosphate synthase subunit HisH [Deltaproteobacteria bacterium]